MCFFIYFKSPLIANHWLKQWQEKHPDKTMHDTIEAFNKAFPMISDNPFL